MAHYAEILPGVAEHSSKMERRADEAERETDRLKKVQYMSQHVGESFDGVISGVTSWGLYVELMNTVEGMIHVSKLPGDYYYFEEKSGEMVGEATGRRFRLGMPVRIIVDECDVAARTIDFSLAKEREDG
jgi:ribonuclease R